MFCALIWMMMRVGRDFQIILTKQNPWPITTTGLFLLFFDSTKIIRRYFPFTSVFIRMTFYFS